MTPNDKEITAEAVKKPVMEVSMEEASSVEQLKDLLDKKTKEKIQLQNINGLHLLEKSKFYYNTDMQLREHIASYNGYAILIKQELIKEELNDKENKMFPSLVKLVDIKKMKKVNGNVIRKINPQSIHEYEKMSMLPMVIVEIDNINKNLLDHT